MFEVWKVGGSEHSFEVRHLGDFPTVRKAREALPGYGPGCYEVWDERGRRHARRVILPRPESPVPASAVA